MDEVGVRLPVGPPYLKFPNPNGQVLIIMKKTNSIVLFNQRQVRRFYDEEKEIWYFSIIDVVEILAETTIPKRYWSDLKNKLKNEGSEVYEKIVRLISNFQCQINPKFKC